MKNALISEIWDDIHVNAEEPVIAAATDKTLDLLEQEGEQLCVLCDGSVKEREKTFPKSFVPCTERNWISCRGK